MEKDYSRMENDITIQKLKYLYIYFMARSDENRDDEAVFCSLRKVSYLLDDAIGVLQNLEGALK